MAHPKSTAVSSKRRLRQLHRANTMLAAGALLLPAARAQYDGPEARAADHPTLSPWRELSSHDLADLRPLDLVLDGAGPDVRAYQKGDGGFLEPYDFDNYQRAAGRAVRVDREDGRPARHDGRARLGPTNLDASRGIGAEWGEWEASARRAEEGDHRGLRGALLKDAGSQSSLPKGSDLPPVLFTFFPYAGEDDPEELKGVFDVNDLAGSPEEVDTEAKPSRRALEAGRFSPDHAKASAAAQQEALPARNLQEKHDADAGNATDDAPPDVRATFPPAGAAVGSTQTFGALVRDAGVGVKKACVQFRDHLGARSECYRLRNVSVDAGSRRLGLGDPGQDDRGRRPSDIWERSFEGFGAYAGREWEYRIVSVDSARNKGRTAWKAFAIDARVRNWGEGTTAVATTTTTTSTAPAATASAAEKLTRAATDEDWPHGGVLQSSTGRILFFFDGNPYVCTGTVLQSAPADRTIVLTAGHCAYQYRSKANGGGRFAEHALFIPNQVDTRGTRSNEICGDDPLGCWIPAFAVVHRRWATDGFPTSVPWDYAYYVIPNIAAAHEGGFIHAGQPDLSTNLEEIVEPLPVDFAWEQSGEFTHGLGYSFNKDPAFRYCADHMTSKFGIPTYQNLWLSDCTMTGGSSGGPWMKDVDADGRGTVVSVNSWGYATSPGMGGPNFATGAGGKAECLYEVARDTAFEDISVEDRGIVVGC